MKDLTQLNKYRLGKVQLLSISFYGEDERYNGVFRIPSQVILPLV